MKKVISAIIPAFNEEKTIALVVETLIKSPLIGEVITVNDGSADQTLTRLKKFRNKIKIINLPQNKGKGFALARGIKAAANKIVAFFDADLTNLSQEHIDSLLKPLQEKKYRAVLGYASLNKIIPNFSANLTGQRAYYKQDLLPHLDEIAQARFGVEVLLNSLFKKRETKKIPLRGLRGLYKYEKSNLTKAIREYANEIAEIAQQVGKREVLPPQDWQIIKTLGQFTDLNEIKEKAKKLQNQKIRTLINKYLIEYLGIDNQNHHLRKNKK